MYSQSAIQHASRPIVRRVGNSNSLELVYPPPVRRNHIRIRKGLGQAHRSPKKSRSQAHHAVVVTCPLKLARRKALEEKFSRLKEKGSNDVTQSAAEVFNDDPIDLDEDYVDVEDPQPANPHKPFVQKRDTQRETQRLYDAWKVLIPSLVLPFLTYMNKSAGHPTANTFEQDNSSCTTCSAETQKTTRILCLFWDREWYIQSFEGFCCLLSLRSRNN
jgi:hypothetical protein